MRLQSKLSLAAIMLAFIGMAFVGDVASAAPYNMSLHVTKANMLANGSDIQSAVVNIDTDTPALMDEVNIIVNYPFNGQSNNARGYFQWTKANGFRKIGSRFYGESQVNLLQPNEQDPLMGSEVLIMTDGVVVTFRWTANKSYGNIADNDVWYHCAERTTGYVHPWTKEDTSFAVDAGNYTAPQFVSLSVSKPVLAANDADMQTATLVVRTSNPQLLDEANLIVNYPMPGQANMARGYFQWTPAVGFRHIYNTYYGARYVNFSRTTSDRSVDAVNGTVTFNFRWAPKYNYGVIADNDISYHFAERTTGFIQPWTKVDTNFAVGTP